MGQAIARILRVVLTIAALLPAASLAAKPKVMTLDIGWGNHYRPGRWNPIRVTLSDPAAAKPYPALLQFFVLHDSSFRMVVSQGLTAGPQSATYQVYLPLTWNLDGTVATLQNLEAGETVDRQEFDASSGISTMSWPSVLDPERAIYIGISGSPTALRSLQGDFDWDPSRPQPQSQSPQNGQPPTPELVTGYMPPADLPDAIQGYEALDLLILNAPDLSRLPQPQQESIAAYVKAGGRLLIWPGPAPIPPQSPIAQILPAQILDPEALTLSIQDTQKLAVATRNERLPNWKLRPSPNAKSSKVLFGKATFHTQRVGFGAVGLLSADVSSLSFNSHDAAANFYRPLLAELLKPQQASTDSTQAYYGGGGRSAQEQWRVVAMEQVIDRLGNVPGIGTFSFSYIAYVMLFLMFIVGPVDWFVLKKLGRQPWTWATTAGWVALITLGGFYVGHLVRSGDLHYRTLQVIDQADGQVAGALDLAGIYAPRTQSYGISGPPDVWWEPASIEASEYYYRTQSRAVLSDIRFVQDTRGQRLITIPRKDGSEEPTMTINVWSLRFLAGEVGDPSSLKPLINADLSPTPDGQRLTGTITNLAQTPLKNLCIRWHGHLAMLTAPTESQTIIVPSSGDVADPESPPQETTPVIPIPGNLPASLAPGQILKVNFQLQGAADDSALRVGGSKSLNHNPWEVQSLFRNTSAPQLQFIRAACDLAMDRSQRVDRLLDNPALACIYAETQTSQPDVKVQAGSLVPKEQHWQVVRALVSLGSAKPENQR